MTLQYTVIGTHTDGPTSGITGSAPGTSSSLSAATINASGFASAGDVGSSNEKSGSELI